MLTSSSKEAAAQFFGLYFLRREICTYESKTLAPTIILVLDYRRKLCFQANPELLGMFLHHKSILKKRPIHIFYEHCSLTQFIEELFIISSWGEPKQTKNRNKICNVVIAITSLRKTSRFIFEIQLQ